MWCEISWPAFEAKVQELKDFKLSAQLISKIKESEQEEKEGENESPNGTAEHSHKNQTAIWSQWLDREWLKTPPKNNEPKHKQIGEKTWH